MPPPPHLDFYTFLRLFIPAIPFLRSLFRGESGVTRTFHFGSDDPAQIFATGNVSRNAAAATARPVEFLADQPRHRATLRWRQRAMTAQSADPRRKALSKIGDSSSTRLLNEDRLCMAVKECAQAWPAVARGAQRLHIASSHGRSRSQYQR